MGRVHHAASWPTHPLPTPREKAGLPPQPLTLTILPTPRLPDLTTVISLDTPLPGTLLLDEVVDAGNKEQNLVQLRHTQQFLSYHDAINIQFTSVGRRSPGPKPRLAC